MKVHDEGSLVESLEISQETLAHIILKARGFDVLTPDTDVTSEEDRADDDIGLLNDHEDNPALHELLSAIEDLSDDEKSALVALFWIGRSDFEATEWDDARKTASERADQSTAQYLAGRPLLADMLEEGAAAMGVNVAGIETSTMYHPADRNPKEQTE